MKRILLCTDGSTFSQNSYQYAAWLAPQLQASIEVLYVSDVRSQKVVSKDYSSSLGFDASRELLNRLVELEHEKAKINKQRAKLILETAGQFFAQQGISEVKLTNHTGFLVDSFQEFEDRADLIMMGKRGENAEFASGHLGANVERVLRSTKKPCFVTSRKYQPISRILLADDGSQSCQRAIEFLVNSPAFKGMELHVLTVVKKAGDEKAHAFLKATQQQLVTGGYTPKCELLQGESEQVITKYMETQNINLLMMGAYGHSRIRRLVIGSTTLQILRSTHVPVLVFR
ncbi:MAG: universal stress protein [Trichormus sp. ATA11-4-KO1]|jgi:nucleotide-binding universal stress UspA family protein|nr:universal stress protein [Trichormus sp. ATA11-4-KO1]